MIEIEYYNQQIPEDKNEIEQIAIEYCIKLIEKWIESKAIDGVKSHDGTNKRQNFECFDDWLHPIRVVLRKTLTIVHVMIQVYIDLSMYKLY